MFVMYKRERYRTTKISVNHNGIVRLPKAIVDRLPTGQVHFTLHWDAEEGVIGIVPCRGDDVGAVRFSKSRTSLDGRLKAFFAWAGIEPPNKTTRFNATIEEDGMVTFSLKDEPR